MRKFLIISVSVLLCLTSCKIGGSKDLAPGSKPPKFSLKNIAGQELSLEKYKGKVVLLNFWASWCAPCIQEIPLLNELYTKTSRDNFEILAIAVNDNIDNLNKTVQNLHMQFPILLDPNAQVSTKYKVNGFPESFLVDKAGDLALVLDDKKGEPVFRVVGPREWSAPHYLDQITKLANK